MKTKQILTAGAIALSMILTGCSASSTGTKDTKTSEVTKKKEVKTQCLRPDQQGSLHEKCLCHT